MGLIFITLLFMFKTGFTMNLLNVFCENIKSGLMYACCMDLCVK